jgi:short-subunit dehydrogenase
MTILIIGSNSDIAKNISKKLDDKKYNIINLQRSNIDFNEKESTNKIFEILNDYKPDAIINFVGVLGNNLDDYETVFNANFKSNWDVIRYFIKNEVSHPIKFLMIGSSSYSSGRKAYMLYSASKAALYNLFLSACGHFSQSNLVIGLINLPRVKTKMISHLLNSESDCMEIEEASNFIVDFLLNLKLNTSVDLGVK